MDYLLQLLVLRAQKIMRRMLVNLTFCCQKMSSMASSFEKALIEIPKSCSAAMHEAMHLVTGNIDNGKSTT